MNLRLLAGACALSFVLGSLHSYSVILAPLEAWLGSSRAGVSFAYSLAIFSLAFGVLLSPVILPRLTLGHAALVAGVVACGGIFTAAVTQSVAGLAVGYGLLFGFGNGLGYALFLNAAGRAVPGSPGTAIGIVSAVYSIGSVAFALLLAFLARRMGMGHLILGFAFCVGTGAAIAAMLMRREEPQTSETAPSRGLRIAPLIMRYWIIYACGAAGALMVAGHAAELVLAAGSASTSAGPTVLALGNVAGCLVGGHLAGRWKPGHGLAAAGMISLAAFLALAMGISAAAVLAPLTATGFAYGVLLTLIPALLTRQLGAVAGATAFGWVFTAWGLAGLSAPWLAGAIFDATGGYGLSMSLATVLAAVGVVTALSLPKETPAGAGAIVPMGLDE